jgi:hypothetical protein
MWKVMMSQHRTDFLAVQEQNERDILELQDLVSIFVVLLIGLGLSALALLFEIFYFDCFRNLDIRGAVRGLWSRVRDMIQRKNKVDRPKVRKINVRPMRRM